MDPDNQENFSLLTPNAETETSSTQDNQNSPDGENVTIKTVQKITNSDDPVIGQTSINYSTNIDNSKIQNETATKTKPKKNEKEPNPSIGKSSIPLSQIPNSTEEEIGQSENEKSQDLFSPRSSGTFTSSSEEPMYFLASKPKSASDIEEELELSTSEEQDKNSSTNTIRTRSPHNGMFS